MTQGGNQWSGFEGVGDFPLQEVTVKRTFVQIDPQLYDKRQIKSWAAGDTDIRDRSTEAEDSAGDLCSRSDHDCVMEGSSRCHNEAASSTAATFACSVGFGTVQGVSRSRSTAISPVVGADPQGGSPWNGVRQHSEVASSSRWSPPKTPRRKRKEGQRSREGEDAARQLLSEGDWPPGTALHLALSGEKGSRVVQRALEDAPCHVQKTIASDFVGHVLLLLRLFHTVHLLETIVMHVEEGTAGFVAQEICSSGDTVLTHKFTCRILCAMLKQRWCAEPTLRLFSEICASRPDLWRKRYTTYLLQDILKLGTADLQQQVMSSLLVDFDRAWPEVSRAIRSPQDPGEVYCVFVVSIAVSEFGRYADALIAALIKDADTLRSLTHRKYGSVLLKAVLQVQGPLAEGARRMLLGALAGISSEQSTSLMERFSLPCAKCTAIQASCRSCSRAVAALQGIMDDLRKDCRESKD